MLALAAWPGAAGAEDAVSHGTRTRANPGGCTVPEAAYAGRVLVEGAANVKASAEECRLACQ